MIQIEYKDKVFDITEDMTIEQYQKYQSNKDMYEKDKLQLLSLFSGIPLYDMKNLSSEEIRLIDFAVTTKFNTPQYDDVVLVFEHNGVEYGLENDWSKLPWGGWVDLEVYSAEDIHENIHKIMSVLYRPVVKKDKKNPKNYKIEPYDSRTIEERAELFKGVSLTYWLSAASFFFQIVTLYINNTQNSLRLMNKTNQILTEGWKRLPKFLRKRISLGSILLSPSNLRKKTLPSLKK